MLSVATLDMHVTGNSAENSWKEPKNTKTLDFVN